jgi:hypothetical protein
MGLGRRRRFRSGLPRRWLRRWRRTIWRAACQEVGGRWTEGGEDRPRRLDRRVRAIRSVDLGRRRIDERGFRWMPRELQELRQIGLVEPRTVGPALPCREGSITEVADGLQWVAAVGAGAPPGPVRTCVATAPGRHVPQSPAQAPAKGRPSQPNPSAGAAASAALDLVGGVVGRGLANGAAGGFGIHGCALLSCVRQM